MTLAVMILVFAMQTHVKLPSCSIGDQHITPSTKEDCINIGGVFKYGEQDTVPQRIERVRVVAPDNCVSDKNYTGFFVCKDLLGYRTAVPQSPMDVPAIKEMRDDVICTVKDWSKRDMTCLAWENLGKKPFWTCADKSRILLTSEDGKKHCILFGAK